MTQEQPVPVLLVDDHPVVTEGLMAAFKGDPHVNVVGVARTAQQAQELIEQLAPQVVLLDLRLPDKSGLALLQDCAGMAQSPAFLVFTAFGSFAEAAEAQRLGALGFVRKGADLQEIRLAIAKASRGEMYWEAGLLSAGGELLTAREREILECLAAGYTTARIARKLGVASSTVKSHVHHLLAKLGAANAREAVYKALQQGLICLPSNFSREG